MRQDGQQPGPSGPSPTPSAPPWRRKRQQAHDLPAPPLALLLLLLLPAAAEAQRALLALPKTTRAFCLERVADCTACAWRVRSGQVLLQCKSCAPGFRLNTTANACALVPLLCAAGTYQPDQNVRECAPCGLGAWCAGGYNSVRVDCVNGTTTRGQYSKNANACGEPGRPPPFLSPSLSCARACILRAALLPCVCCRCLFLLPLVGRTIEPFFTLDHPLITWPLCTHALCSRAERLGLGLQRVWP